MCRLFAMSSAPQRAQATFWLLDAPDSLSDQSHRDPDGVGLGYFGPRGAVHIHKAPVAAYEDRTFAQEARQIESETFVAHVRFASTGGLQPRNTHPFEQDGRIFAHNGVIEGLDLLDAELGEDRALVKGDTDSERFFALITRRTREHGGDIAAGIEHAARWIAQNLPVFALNLVLATPEEVWALRYPDTHVLYLLQRRAGGNQGTRHLDHSGTAGHLRVHSSTLAGADAVVIASEKMDENPHWRLMESGELVHIGPDLQVTQKVVLPDPPAHRLTLDDLRPEAAKSQRAA